MKSAEIVRRIIEQDFGEVADPQEGQALIEFNKLLSTGRIKPNELGRHQYQLANEHWTLDRGMLGLLNQLANPIAGVPGEINEALVNFFQNRLNIKHEDTLKIIELLPKLVKGSGVK